MTIEDVYDAIKVVIDAVSVPYSAATYDLIDKALIIPCSSLKGEQDQWGGQLVSVKDSSRIHAWFWTQRDTEIESERVRAGQSYGWWVVTLYGYLQQRAGTHADNSDRQFAVECNAIELAFNAVPSTLPEALRTMRPFKLARNATTKIGREQAHFAIGNLIIRSC